VSLVHRPAEAKKDAAKGMPADGAIAPRFPATISAHLASGEQFATYTIVRA
jgi:hypothetical protein